jgi:hypothetical protein
MAAVIAIRAIVAFVAGRKPSMEEITKIKLEILKEINALEEFVVREQAEDLDIIRDGND